MNSRGSNDDQGHEATTQRLGASLLKGTTLVAIALGLAQVAAYLVNVVSARALGPEQFGILSAMLGLILIGNVVALGLQAVIARTLVATPQSALENAGRGLRLGVICGLAVLGAALILSPFLAWFLQLDGWLPLVWVAITLAPLTWIGAQLGVAQGRERFARLALIYLAVGLGRGLGGVTGALLGETASSTLLGIMLGSLAGALIGRIVVAPYTESVSGGFTHLMRPVAHATHALFALFLLTNIDVVFARALLTPEQAGEYGVGAIIIKIAFWLPQFVGVIAFPRLADSRRGQALAVTLLGVGGLGTLVVAGTALLPGLIINAVGGPEYQQLIPIAWIFALIGALFALAQVLLLSRLAIDDRRAVMAIWATLIALSTLAFVILPATVTGLAISVALAAVMLCLAGISYTLWEMRAARVSRAARTISQ